MRTRKKLIEVALPLDAINAASAREKSIRHGHPRRCCMKTLRGWGGVARTSLDAPQEPHYSDEVEGPSHV